MNDKRQEYIGRASETIGQSIFSSDWWLDALAPGQWESVTIKKNGRVHARLPYLVRPTPFGPILSMPVLTQTLGPSLLFEGVKQTQRLSRYKAFSEQLIQHLPRHAGFRQNFHYSIENWLPWYWAGFQQTTRYTYVLEDLKDHKKLWDGFDQRIRRSIRKAEKLVDVSITSDFDEFWDLNKKVFTRQGLGLPYTKQTVQRLDQACAGRQQRGIFVARDQEGRSHAAAYIVWDDNSAYYLMGGSDPNLRQSGAQSLLMWRAIQYASTVTRAFNFEGSMIEPIERFFRGFGGVPKPYHRIWKMSVQAQAYLFAGRCYKRSMKHLQSLARLREL